MRKKKKSSFLLPVKTILSFTGIILVCSCSSMNNDSEKDTAMVSDIEESSLPSKKIINTENAPQVIGPYSQAVEYNGLIFISGQLAIEPATGNFINGSIKEQTTLVLKNISSILESEGLTMSNVLKATCLLADINDYKPMNEVYADFFTEDEPARAAFQVASLPLGAKIEIEVIAGR